MDDFRSICFVRTGESGDADTFERALRLSQGTQAELAIIGIVEEPPAGIRGLIASLGAGLEAVDIENEQAKEVERLVERAGHENVRATSAVLHGSALEIVRKVLRDKHDLLIKTAQPSAVASPAVALGRVVIGSQDGVLYCDSGTDCEIVRGPATAKPARHPRALLLSG